MTGKPYTVVVGVDFEANGDLALDAAFAAAAERSGEVHAVHVARILGPQVYVDFGGKLMTLTMEQAAERLQSHVATRLKAYVSRGHRAPERVVTHLGLDAPSFEIAQLASDLEAQLVVVGTHGHRGLARAFMGSVAETTVRLAPCAVLVVRPEQPSSVPAIEPPCPRCVETRRDSKGQTLWCAQHQERHGRRHTYHFVNRTNHGREALPGLGSDD